MEVDLIVKEREPGYEQVLQLPLLLRRERLWGETPGEVQLTALAGKISIPKPSWGIAALKTSPGALPKSSL